MTDVTSPVHSIPIVPVRLKFGDKKISAYVMLDSFSTGTFISEGTNQQLGNLGVNTKVAIKTIKGIRTFEEGDYWDDRVSV